MEYLKKGDLYEYQRLRLPVRQAFDAEFNAYDTSLERQDRKQNEKKASEKKVFKKERSAKETRASSRSSSVPGLSIAQVLALASRHKDYKERSSDDRPAHTRSQLLTMGTKVAQESGIMQGRYTFSGQGRYRRKKVEGLGGWWKGPGFKKTIKRRPRRRRIVRPVRRYNRKPIYHRNPIIHQKRQLAFMKRRGISPDERNAMSLGASLARASEVRRATVEKIQKKRARFSNSVYDPEGTLLDSLLGGNNQAEYKDSNSSTSSMMSRLSVGQL